MKKKDIVREFQEAFHNIDFVEAMLENIFIYGSYGKKGQRRPALYPPSTMTISVGDLMRIMNVSFVEDVLLPNPNKKIGMVIILNENLEDWEDWGKNYITLFN